MAKSTSTTKAKTKTTNKKASTRTAAAKTTKSSVKAKATKSTAASKKTVTKKAPVKVAEVKKTSTNKASFTSRFNQQYVLAGIILGLEAVLAGILMKADSVQVFMSHLTKNELLSSTSTVLAYAAHPLYELQLRWVLVVFLGVSALFAIARGTKWQHREAAGVKTGVQPLRWIDFAVTGAIFFELVGLLNGVQDAVALKLGMLSIALTAYFAWMYERENAATGKPARASLIGSQVAAAVPILALAATMWSTYVYGMVRSPWYAYAAAAAFVAWLCVIQLKLKKTPAAGKQNYASVDKSYNVLTFLARTTVAVVLIVGLYASK